MLKLPEERRKWGESKGDCHKIKDGGYNNITNTNKVSPAQNTPALQARRTRLDSLGSLDSLRKNRLDKMATRSARRRIHCPLPTLTLTNTATTIYEVDVLNLSFSKLRLFKAGVSGQRKTASKIIFLIITLLYPLEETKRID